ncbi:hypothetical protein PMAYCL1PPCAC_14449, partial [Pristionchus mayeri]
QPVPPPPAVQILELRQLLLMARQDSVNTQQQVINAGHQLIMTEQEMARRDDMHQSQLREMKMRAERAENLLDSRQGCRDEPKEKELEENVIGVNDRAKQKNCRIDKLSDQLEKEKNRASEMEKSVSDLTTQLEEEKEGRSRSDQ